MSKRTKTIEVEWDDDQEFPESGLPMYVDIPRDMLDEDVARYLLTKYGYVVYSWQEV